MGVRIFMHHLIKDDLTELESQQLIRDFRNYKEGKGLPATFGRDVPYDHTFNRQYVQLQHIHLKRNGQKFPLRVVQFNRTSGSVLVYCPGYFDRNAYLLIAIAKHFDPQKPNEIEDTDKDPELMAIFEKIAEGFRERF